jgi:hypothetical protein
MRILFLAVGLILSACASEPRPDTARSGSLAGQDFVVAAPVNVVFERLQMAMARCWPTDVSGALDDKSDAQGRRKAWLAVAERSRNRLGETERYNVDIVSVAEGTRVISYRGARVTTTTVGLDHIHRRVREWANGQDSGC